MFSINAVDKIHNEISKREFSDLAVSIAFTILMGDKFTHYQHI